MGNFGICVEDGSEPLPQLVVEQNSSSLELYDWQERAIKYFFENNSAIFEVTTGAGKTFCAIEIIKKILQKNSKIQILIVVPKNVILERTWYKELYDNGISLTKIGVYYGLAKEYAQITLTNMQNIHNVALELFDMVVFDEIHNYATQKLIKIINYPFKYKLGLSATVERMDGRHKLLLRAFSFNVFKFAPHQALREGILNEFHFINVSVELDSETMEEYLELTKELNLIFQMGGGFNRIIRTSNPLKFRMMKKLNERKQLVLNYYKKFDAIQQICEKHRNDKVIIFNEYNSQTNKVYWHLLDIGIKARIMHSGISHEKREENLTDFKKDRYNILCASKVLDEGYNLPKIDTGIIMAGNSTAKQTIQRMGRVLRKKDKHSNLYQIYCKNTMEEDYAVQRSKLFKELCSRYEEIEI